MQAISLPSGGQSVLKQRALLVVSSLPQDFVQKIVFALYRFLFRTLGYLV